MSIKGCVDTENGVQSRKGHEKASLTYKVVEKHPEDMLSEMSQH